jgi:DNA mismatch repair protein MutS2
MVQAGLHIPADGDSEMPIFTQIYADIGDEQSLEQSLSTFSSHLRQIVKVLEHADQDTLVLLDEIGVGTDPEEGTALALAVLETLTERRVRTVATTHYGALKVFAHDRPGIENASLEFDRQTLRPTYRFHLGIPGSSYALEIANRLGMQPAVLKRATDILGPDTKETAELIEDLKERVVFYQQKSTQLLKQQEELEQLTQSYREKLADVRQEEGCIREKAYHDAEAILAQANATVERVIAEIRKGQASKEIIKEAHRVLDEQTSRVKKHLQAIAPKEQSSPVSLQKGDPVWVEGLEAQGEVVAKLGRGARYKVQVGNLVMEVDGTELRRLSKPVPGQRIQSHTSEDGQSFADGASDEIDLRGLTADEAIGKLQRCIDRAILAGLNTLWVIHGKGTGVLRRRVGDFLKDSPGIKSYRLGAWNEGGDGVTVVELQ